MENIVAIIQARLGSMRLPGKVLAQVLGRPLLWYQIERLRICRKISKIVVATTDLEKDTPIEEFCKNYSIDCFRGNQDDVLDRYYQAALKFKAESVVRITADCPLIDPGVADSVIEFYLKNPGFDLVRTGQTYPEGFDTEILPFKSLAITWKEATLKSEREHVTAFLWKNENRFKIKTLQSDTDYSYLRLTVDEQVDFEVVKEVLEELYPKKGIDFYFEDILELYKSRRSIFEKNSRVVRNEGYLKSIREDKIIGKN